MAHEGHFKIGKYSLGERLGTGGFGVVRKAVKDADGSAVAVKILDKSELRLHEMTQHVKKEITLLTMLQHPNIVKGIEVLNSKTKIFLVMEYVDGGDMHSALTARKRFPEDEARKLFYSLMDCLAYCHEKGVFHRDLKLENLLLTSSGVLKVCDFGLASVRSMNGGKSDLCKTVVGTEDFSPPEILKNVPYKGDKADMWSAGILLFVMIAGYCPFQGRTPGELAQRIIECKYSFPSWFPSQPRKLISRLLTPEGRYRLSASSVLKDEWFGKESPRSVISSAPNVPPTAGSSKHSKTSTPGRRGRHSMAIRYRRAQEPAKTSSPVSISEDTFRNISTVTTDGSKASKLFGKNDHAHVLFKSLGQANVPNFVSMLAAMRDSETGLRVQDRKWRLKTFNDCFIGSEAVSWISNYLTCPRDMAVVMGQKLLNAGAFHHVCREHDFQDGFLFYRWHEDDPENKCVMNLRASYARNLNTRSADFVAFDLLNQLMAVCKIHQRLNDYMEIDMVGVQQDELFRRFLTSAGELQTATLPINPSDEQKIPFLVNLHNLLWMQARVHIGDFEELTYEGLKSTAEKLQYSVNGRKISLFEVSDLLSNPHSSTVKDAEQPDLETNRRPGQSMSTALSGKALQRLFAKMNNSEAEVRELLQPDFVDPLVHFLTSDGSPESPQVRALSKNCVSAEFLIKSAAQYLDTVLTVDMETCSLSYPHKVSQFRDMIKIKDNTQFVTHLYDICEGYSVAADLQQLLHLSRKLKIPPAASRKEDRSLPYSRVTFAPNVGKSMFTTESHAV